MTLFAFLDYASVFVFALTGSLVASRAQLDVVGFLFFACLTAVGGGTLRDVLLDRNPVFWIENLDGLGAFSAAMPVVDDDLLVTSLHVADVNGDGVGDYCDPLPPFPDAVTFEGLQASTIDGGLQMTLLGQGLHN